VHGEGALAACLACPWLPGWYGRRQRSSGRSTKRSSPQISLTYDAPTGQRFEDRLAMEGNGDAKGAELTMDGDSAVMKEATLAVPTQHMRV
jgi:hypothetical protein